MSLPAEDPRDALARDEAMLDSPAQGSSVRWWVARAPAVVLGLGLSHRQASIVDIERFEGVGFTRSSRGYAILDDVLAVIECDRISMFEAGDHTVIVGQVEATRAETGTPLLYYRGGYAQLER